jgi:uncharacterized protein YuzE
MNLIYNSNADTFHIRFVDEPAAKQDDVGHGLVLHRDASGGIVEIELRDARQRLSKEVELPGPSPFS